MKNDESIKKSWTSPTLEALEMASTAGGDPPEEAEEFDGGES